MRRLITVLSTTACAAGLIAAVPSAQAAANAHLQLELTKNTAQVKQEQTFHYHATNLRPDSRVVLQDLEGTWETRATSAPKHGTVNGTFHVDGPAGPSKEIVRVVAVHKKDVYAKSAHETLYVYGQVSLKNLCHGVLHKSLEAHANTCNSGSESAAHGKTFYYALVTGETTPSQGYRPQFGADATSCRSITLRYNSDDDGQESIELHQDGLKPRKDKNNGDNIGSLTSKLTGKKFGVSVSEEDNDLFTGFGGFASCYTYDGKP